MKNIIKIAFLILVLNASIIQAKNENSTILLSKANDSYSLDFLNSNNVTSLQFDVVVQGVKMDNSITSSCVSGLPKTHAGSCNILKNGKLRVAIFSTKNEVLESGNIGNFKLNSKASEIKINNVVMGSVDLKQVQGDAVIDLGDIDFSFNEKLK